MRRSEMRLLTLLAFFACFGITQSEPKMKNAGIPIGIDLGTTYSCVGVYKNGHVEIIANEQGNRITASYVAFTSDGRRLIGDSAKNQMTINPDSTIFDVKRLIGRSWSDKNVQNDIKSFPFKVIEKDSKPYIEVNTSHGQRMFAPEEISAMILNKMKNLAENYLNEKVTHAVITVPAYFNDAQRQATKDAGEIAGLNVMRIINEPTAAAIAYGLNKDSGEKRVLVFDLGGGTFDVSILIIEEGMFEVVATSGDTHLGGEDFDLRVIDYYARLIKIKKGKDVFQNSQAFQKLRRIVERAKCALSTASQVRIEIESLFENVNFTDILTRTRFENLNFDLFRLTITIVKEMLNEIKLSKKDIDEIVMVGGSTRIPKVKALVASFFSGRKLSEGINPDEAIAFGATVQAGILCGLDNTQGIVLLDVNPLTLGIETESGVMTPLIPRNSMIPTRISKEFSTAVDNQTSVTIQVYEGEQKLTKDNNLLGKFDLIGVPPAPRGVPRIKVTFEINANGILRVSAEDLQTGNKNKIIVKNTGKRLTRKDIAQMERDSELFAAENLRVKDSVIAQVDLESYIESIMKDIHDMEKFNVELNDENYNKIEIAIDEAVKWMEQNSKANSTEYEMKKQDLETIVEPIIRKLFKNAVIFLRDEF